jgi:uncharacterized OB-fold protein
MTTSGAHRDDASAPWFDGLAQGRLLIRACRSCGHRSRPETVTCPACRGPELEWVPAAGVGTVICVITDHGLADPVTLGLVELDEGPWLLVRVRGAAPPAAGMRVRLSVHQSEGSEPIPVFTTDF